MMSKNELVLYGTVGASWWDEEYFTAKMVRDQLAEMSGDIVVRINSGGGIASEGQAIYTALIDYPGKVTVQVDGVAASAASLIAMAGDEIVMRRGAWMLIHDPATPWTMGRGTEEDHLKEAELLRVISGAYADIYAARSGLSRDECRKVMQDETVLDGPMAVDMGFATSVEADSEAVAIATFDYRIYAHAPDEARKGSRTLGRAPVKEAVMAMFAGRARPTQLKEAPMAKTKTAAGATLAEIEVTTHVEGVTVEEAVTEDGKAVIEVTVPEAVATVDAGAAATTRARRILASVSLAGLPTALADSLIASKKSVEECLDDITAHWKENGDVDTPMKGAPTARILRDERETQTAGMGLALQARLGVPDAKVDGTAGRAFMNMSLAEMAAHSMGQQAPRDADGKLRVFMAGTHSTSDFAGIFENALNKRLQRAYELAMPTYREIAQRMDFSDYRPHPVAGVGELTPMTEVAEGAEIKHGTFNDKRESIQLRAYGTMAEITEQMIVNDDLNAISTMLSRAGQVAAANEDSVFYAMMLSASAAGPTLGETARAVFNTTDNTLAASAAAITVASLTIARAALMTKRSLNGLDLNMVPAVLLVGPAKLTEAQQVVSPLQADSVSNQNPFAGTLKIVVTPKITGNSWYLFADPALAANFAYGFLQGAEGPQVRNDTPIGRLGLIYQITHRFGCGAIDFRAGFRNAGA
jgi:ATP-dependent protease ClpP protease subunit/phage major head subunit gpT-like protein